MKIEYTKVGDYYLPNLYYPEETRPIGFWGILRKKYLKEHKSGTYTYLLLTTRLDSYLADMNEQANAKCGGSYRGTEETESYGMGTLLQQYPQPGC